MERKSNLIKFLKFVFVGIPNLPFIIAMVFYLYWKMIKETAVVEMVFMSDEDIKNSIVKAAEMYKNKTVINVVAIMVWTIVVGLFIR